MAAISAQLSPVPLSCVDPVDLASKPIGSLLSGDLAYVASKAGSTEGPLFMLDRTSTLPVDGVGVLATSAPEGRWLSLVLYNGGALTGLSQDVLAGPGPGVVPATVVGLEGYPIEPAAPVNGDALLFNGMMNRWDHAPIVFGGGPPVGPAGGDLGGLYPNPSVVGLQSRPLSGAAPSVNDVIAWDGAQWEPTSPSVIVSAASAVYGNFSDSTDQAFVVGGPYVVKFDTTEGANGVSVVNNTDPIPRPTRITVAQAGVYSFALSPQILHTGGGQEIITFWARVDGTNVPRSASSLEMGNNNNRTLPYIELVLTMNAGQYLEWVFQASNGTNVTLEAYPAVVGPNPVPAIPSVIAAVKRLGTSTP